MYWDLNITWDLNQISWDVYIYIYEYTYGSIRIYIYSNIYTVHISNNMIWVCPKQIRQWWVSKPRDLDHARIVWIWARFAWTCNIHPKFVFVLVEKYVEKYDVLDGCEILRQLVHGLSPHNQIIYIYYNVSKFPIVTN